jgi:hypothetical protein
LPSHMDLFPASSLKSAAAYKVFPAIERLCRSAQLAASKSMTRPDE